MFARAVIAFLVMPGVVALGIPLWIGLDEMAADGRFNAVGLLPLGAGFTMLIWCVYDFYESGKGTLAPWSPPKHLVTNGLYRFSRNPMYVAVTLMLAGWSVVFGSPVLATYTASVLVGFHLRILFGEEPWLARTHGAQWEEYRARVPRWLI
jgi:protein-S-isoprenylcysteine O-methyltransferase Ste14